MLCETLDAYLQRYGGTLGENAKNQLDPLHVPGRDPIIAVPTLRKSFPAQAHVITAGVRALRRQKTLNVVGQMGVGKTFIAQATIHGHAEGKPYRCLVFCPPHLPKKWEREYRQTIAKVNVVQIDHWKTLATLGKYSFIKPSGPEVWIVSQSVAKLGTKWVPVYKTGVHQADANQYNGKLKKGVRSQAAFCPTCMSMVTKEKEGSIVPVDPKELAKKKHTCETCKQPLWQHVGKRLGGFDRWPAASFISRKMPGCFDYLIVDEVHQEKSEVSLQGIAMSALASSVKKVITLTGTLIGGQADHLRTLLFRTAPKTIVGAGFGWDDYMPFSEKYGRIETRVTTTEKHDRNRMDCVMGRGQKTERKKYVRPGVMPTLFGEHLMDKCVFLSLDEVAEQLPHMHEEAFHVEMDAELADEYGRIEEALRVAVKELMQKGSTKLLGAMLQALLGYPDHPYGWKEIGYYDYDESGDRYWRGVVTPKDLDRLKVRPKEKRLLELIKHERAAGRKVWTYCVMTETRDVVSRLKSMCVVEGHKTMDLRSSVPTKDREEWIAKNGPLYDVIMSHPQLVETGLDLFDKGGAYNFPTLIFYSTGYSAFTLRQAGARAWRIGQPLPCKTLYLAYKDTMQEKALKLMGEKMSASCAIEGKFSTEGLAALAGEEASLEMELAKSLCANIKGDRKLRSA